MVCYTHSNSRFQQGSGLMDSLLRPFTVSKYGNEMHSRSLDPNHFLQGYTFNGPKTEVLLREKLGDDKALNDLDRAAKEHDYAYLREKSEYEKDHNKQKHINNIHRADDVFIDKAKNSRDDPIMGAVSSKLIAGKKKLEESGLLNTTQFSGFGASEEEEISDPVARLRNLVEQEYKSETKHKKTQKGGFLPLVPIATAVAGALASKLTSELYDFVKKKITSGGGKVPYHKTRKEQLEFLKEFIIRLK